MPRSICLTAGESMIIELANHVDEEGRKRILMRYDVLRFAKVFEDAEVVSVCYCLFENDLNVKQTAQKLYMHRNTLIYRLKKLKCDVGLDITTFSDAVIFIILHCFYVSKRGTSKVFNEKQ